MPKQEATRAAFGAKLHELRQISGLSQTELANACAEGPASHQANISMWERGEPPESLDYEVVQQLETVLGDRHHELASSLGMSAGNCTVSAALMTDEKLTPAQRRMLMQFYRELTGETE